MQVNHYSSAIGKSLCLSFIFIFSIFTSQLLAQEQVGKPLITNYKYQEYGASPVNWWALEDDNGNMYFANGAGVLQFDGVNWRTIPIEKSARCLAKNTEGTIFVGGISDFGYLKPDSTGELKFISLLDKVPEEHRNFRDVWEVDYYRGRIIFRTEFKLYAWDGEQMKVISSDLGYHVGSVVNDIYYLRIWNKGLCILQDDDTFELAPEGERFANERIYSMLPYDDKTMLIGTRTQGFYLFDGKTYKPFKTEADPYIYEKLYLPGAALKNGNFVFNTFSDGVYQINHEGKLIQKYTTENGLQDGSVDYVYEDSRGVLWMMLFNGISNVNLNSTFTSLDTNMGLPTNVVFATYRFKGILYLSTNNGIFYLDENLKEIKLIPGTNGQGGNFLENKGRLYVGTGGMGVIEIIDKTFRYIRESINYDLRARILFFSQVDENRMYIAHQQGVTSLYFNEEIGEFVQESETDTRIPSANNSIEEDEEGRIWIQPETDGELKVLIPKLEHGTLVLSDSEIITLNEENGLPPTSIGFWKMEGELHFFSRPTKESFIFNKKINQFEKKSFFYNDFVGWERGGGLAYPIKDSNDKIWLNAGKGTIVATPNGLGGYEIDTETFKGIKSTISWDIYPETPDEKGTQMVWLSGPDGVIRYEGNFEKPLLPDFHVDIRNLTITGDSLVYGGNIDFPEKLSIPFDKNSVTLGYAAPLFIGQKEIKYSTQLSGLDDTWSDWTTQTSREYINLPAGDYTFNVRAQNIYGDITEESSASFSIIPPWYKTWWAYALYALGILGFIYFSVKVRTKILLNQQKVLEDTVAERTKEANQRLKELATVNQVSQALTEKLQLNDLIQLVGDEMKKLFKSDITYLAILDPDTNIISFPYEDGDDMQPMNYGEGLTSQIIKTGKSLLINLIVRLVS